jgi:hypothetical protein
MHQPTPTRTIELTIHGITFAAPQPFAQGHVCTEGEASVLNAQFAENLRNNFAKRVKAWQESNPGEDAEHDGGLHADFKRYAASYTLAPRTSADPIDRAAHRIATDLVRESLNAKGMKQSDLADGQFDEFVRKVAARPAVRDEATRRVAATKHIVSQTLDLDELA